MQMRKMAHLPRCIRQRRIHVALPGMPQSNPRMPMQIVRRLIVIWLEKACTALDLIGYRYHNHTHYLANLSNQLDEKWHTGVWQRMSNTEKPDPNNPPT